MKGENEQALTILEEGVYLLKHYGLSDYVKFRTLICYSEALRREERHFEGNEVFQQIYDLKVEGREINDEMLFIPEYFF